MDTSGIMTTWNGMTIEAIIMANRILLTFHLGLRTITYAVIEEKTTRNTVDTMVMKAEFAKEFQKFIFSIALGKFLRVKPCLPIRASGLPVISALDLNTLMMTIKKGETNQSSSRVRITIITIWVTRLLRAMRSFSVIMPAPRLSCQYKPAQCRPPRTG